MVFWSIRKPNQDEEKESVSCMFLGHRTNLSQGSVSLQRGMVGWQQRGAHRLSLRVIESSKRIGSTTPIPDLKSGGGSVSFGLLGRRPCG